MFQVRSVPLCTQTTLKYIEGLCENKKTKLDVSVHGMSCCGWVLIGVA